uniref:Protein kinase domain-containing protein n=1 Tax=Panagrolaimus sp. ES5 TaxID=591445 RepID=A0AC34GG37_9BILA
IMRQRGTLLSERRIWYYFHQICNGLKDIHHAKILHRDLKPANIFMCKNGSVKIGDLGLACYVNDETKLEKSSTGTE